MSIKWHPRFESLASRALLAAIVVGGPGLEPVLLWLNSPAAAIEEEVPRAIRSGRRLLGLVAVTKSWRVQMECVDAASEDLMREARSEFLTALALLRANGAAA